MLSLTIINKPQDAILVDNQKVFHEQGGNIGRAEHCDLILPDPSHYISKIHALIHFRDQMYFITDVSSNGVFLNTSTMPIGKGNTKQILEGERFRIGNYVLQASYKEETLPLTSLQNDPSSIHVDDEIESILKKSHSLDDLLIAEQSTSNRSLDTGLSEEYKSIDDLLSSLEDDPEMIELDLLDNSPQDIIGLLSSNYTAPNNQFKVLPDDVSPRSKIDAKRLYDLIIEELQTDSFSQHFDPEILMQFHQQLLAHKDRVLKKIN